MRVGKIKFFHKSYDGGEDSGVTGYWLIEWKGGFSICLLKFSEGSREAFHSHAFNAYTWWLLGEVEEYFQDGKSAITWTPSFKPKYTPKDNFHKIIGKKQSWALCIRGKWDDTWKEYKNEELYTLTHGRKRVK